MNPAVIAIIVAVIVIITVILVVIVHQYSNSDAAQGAGQGAGQDAAQAAAGPTVAQAVAKARAASKAVADAKAVSDAAAQAAAQAAATQTAKEQAAAKAIADAAAAAYTKAAIQSQAAQVAANNVIAQAAAQQPLDVVTAPTATVYGGSDSITSGNALNSTSRGIYSKSGNNAMYVTQFGQLCSAKVQSGNITSFVNWCSPATGPSGQYVLQMQTDGNVCVHPDTPGTSSLWCSDSAGKGASPYILTIGDDGTIVERDSVGNAQWVSG